MFYRYVSYTFYVFYLSDSIFIVAIVFLFPVHVKSPNKFNKSERHIVISRQY